MPLFDTIDSFLPLSSSKALFVLRRDTFITNFYFVLHDLHFFVFESIGGHFMSRASFSNCPENRQFCNYSRCAKTVIPSWALHRSSVHSRLSQPSESSSKSIITACFKILLLLKTINSTAILTSTSSECHKK